MSERRDMGVKCKKCKDTGWYAYDHNHRKICEQCCPHDEGWWELRDGYAHYIDGLDNGCCIRGCGTMRREKLRRYIPYREARECLRKQQEFLADIKSRGIEALKQQPQQGMECE